MSFFRLRLYADDATTLVGDFSTDPAAAYPLLRVPTDLVGQNVDFQHGRASIGGCKVEVVDLNGVVTGLLGGANGRSALSGRRALLTSGADVVIDAVIDDIILHDSFASFEFVLKDQRENERRTRAFTNATTSAVMPRGVIGGWGFVPESGEYLLPPVTPLVGTYQVGSVIGQYGYSSITFPTTTKNKNNWRTPTVDKIVTPAMDKVFRDVDENGTWRSLRILWRPVGGGAWNIIEDLNAGGSNGLYGDVRPYYPVGGEFKVEDEWVRVNYLEFFAWVDALSGAGPRPTHGQQIEFIIGYNGAPSKEYPLHIDGMTFGELLAGLYDGDYSEDSEPRVRYDAATVALLNKRVRARVTEPLDDDDGIWKWVESNIYAPLGAAPALDNLGRVSPVFDSLPPEGATLLELNDANCEPVPGWNQAAGDTINIVRIEFKRVYRVPAVNDPNGERSAGDGIAEQEVSVEHRNIGSIEQLGEQPLVLKPETLLALGGAEGEPLGERTDELGFQIAKERTRSATDRYLYGGQHFAVGLIDRAAWAGHRVGDWALGALSWWPEYTTNLRGANRLAQIVSARIVDDSLVELELIDAGPDNVPVGQPTLGALELGESEGTIIVPVTALPAGAEARVDYAVANVQPAADSELWRFLDRTDVVADLPSPPTPGGTNVWVRSRGEKEGRRPSAWTNAVSIAVPAVPRLLDVRLVVDEITGAAELTWTPNTQAAGVRIRYGSHDPDDPPPYSAQVDVDATLGTYAWADGTVPLGMQFTIEAQPYTGFGGGSVSGTAGQRVQRSDFRFGTEAETAEALSIISVRETLRTAATIEYEIVRGALVDSVYVYTKTLEHQTPDPWTEVEAETPTILPDGDDDFEIPVPPPGYLTYAKLVPHAEDIAVTGPAWMIIENPTLEPPDQIVGASAAVDNDTGSVLVRVFAVDRTRSYRYAYNVGVDPAWPQLTDVEAGPVRSIHTSDSFLLPAGTVAFGQKVRVRLAPYRLPGGVGTDGAEDHGEVFPAEGERTLPPVELEKVGPTDLGGGSEQFGVVVRDNGGIATALWARTRSGAGAVTAWGDGTVAGVPVAQPPVDGTLYEVTVDMVEGHPATTIEFRLDYMLNGSSLSIYADSGPLDYGAVPNIDIVPHFDENLAAAMANVIGDSDTKSVRIVAAVAAEPADATVRAAAPINGRMLSAAQIGTLLTGLTPGAVVHFKAFGYSQLGGLGIESSKAAHVVALFSTIAPVLVPTFEDETDTLCQFGVTPKDPAARAVALYYQSRDSGQKWPTTWTLKSAAPAHNVEYRESAVMAEGHPAQLRFRLDYVLNGQLQSVAVESPVFDLGRVSNVTGITISFADDGAIVLAPRADSDTRNDGSATSLRYTIGIDEEPADPDASSSGIVLPSGAYSVVHETAVVADAGEVVTVKMRGYSVAGTLGPVTQATAVRGGGAVGPAPSAAEIVLSVYAASNMLNIAISEVTAEATRWRVWVKRGAQPTTNGTATGAPDDQYRVVDQPVSSPNVPPFYVQDGLYYVIAHALNQQGNPGPRFSMSLAVTSGGGNVPPGDSGGRITNQWVEQASYSSPMVLRWTVNAQVGTGHTVNITGQADESGSPTGLGSVAATVGSFTVPVETSENYRHYSFTIELFEGTTLRQTVYANYTTFGGDFQL